jgi:dinuclear metal center YbgI/SA1388 family protein
MRIKDIINYLEEKAPPALQESYDNCGLIIGDADTVCEGIITCLDATEAVVMEAVEKKCNLIVAHHPIIFSGLKKINGKNYVEKTVIAAIKNNIAIYAIHTNLDNVIDGVNGRIADVLALTDRQILYPKTGMLKKLYTYVPTTHLAQLRDALFEAGGGNIGNYVDCSFTTPGEGSFMAKDNASPFVGEIGKRHYEPEQKLEVVFEGFKEKALLNALIKNHPYEQVAYEIIGLENSYQNVGSGIFGNLDREYEEAELLEKIKTLFNLKMIKHTPFLGKRVKKLAICGGAGSFLIPHAIASGADIYISADMKYHEFFDANGRILIADMGHYESEQFTIDLLAEVLQQKFTTFAVLKTGIVTNSVQYFT